MFEGVCFVGCVVVCFGVVSGLICLFGCLFGVCGCYFVWRVVVSLFDSDCCICCFVWVCLFGYCLVSLLVILVLLLFVGFVLL